MAGAVSRICDALGRRGGQCACCASAGGEDTSAAFVMHVRVLIIS
jgi:hypothetical protein